ncbi:MAG: hypothetical protein ACXWV5_08905 [Flavitalea sp.]
MEELIFQTRFTKPIVGCNAYLEEDIFGDNFEKTFSAVARINKYSMAPINTNIAPIPVGRTAPNV